MCLNDRKVEVLKSKSKELEEIIKFKDYLDKIKDSGK